MKAGRALANLSVDEEIKVLIAKRGAIKACIRILEKRDEDAALVEALATLANLAVHDSIEVAIGEQNGLGPIVQLLTSEHDGVKHQAERAIHNLSKSAKNRKIIDELMMKVDDEFVRSRRPSLMLPPPIPPEDGGYQPLDMLEEESLENVEVPTYDKVDTKMVDEVLVDAEDDSDSSGDYDESQLPPLPPQQSVGAPYSSGNDSDSDNSENVSAYNPPKRRKSSVVAPPQVPPPQVPSMETTPADNRSDEGSRRSRRSTVGPPPSPPTIAEALTDNGLLTPVEEQVYNALNMARTRPWKSPT